MHPLGAHDPKRVGPYRLLGRLGAGGMGQVFLGQDRKGVQVAVKVVHPGLAHDERFRLRFRREVEISRTVTGPWVAAVVDADPDARTPWLATQYVRGPSLAAAVEADGPLPVSAVHALAHGLAIALAAVHEAGLVHRDLKPSNVLLGSDHPRLIDFGISRAIDGTQVTSTGVVVGTPAFMSPEQIAGEEVGPASDVFSLGSVLAYAATGRSPFGDHPPLALMMRISGREPDLDGVPDVLRGPVAACLAKRPQERPTAGELSGVLGTVVDGPARVVALGGGAPTVVPAPTRIATEVPPSAGAPQLSRRAWLGIVGSAGLLAAGGFGLVAAIGAPRAPEARWVTPVSSQLDHPSATVDEGAVYVYGGDGVHALDSVTGVERWSVPGWVRHESGLDWSATIVVGGVLVIGTSVGIALFDTVTGRLIRQVPGPISTFAAADGVLVRSTEGTGLEALDVVSGGRIWGDRGWARTSIAHDGVLYSGEFSDVVARDLRSGRLLWRYPTGAADHYSLAVADGVVAVGSSVTVTALDAATGRPWWRASHSAQDLLIAGNALVAEVEVGEQVTVRALDLATGAPRWALPETADIGTPALLGADGIVYVRPYGGPTSAYDAASGGQRWVYSGDEGTREPLAARARDLYLFDSLQGGRIQAVRIP